MTVPYSAAAIAMPYPNKSLVDTTPFQALDSARSYSVCKDSRGSSVKMLSMSRLFSLFFDFR